MTEEEVKAGLAHQLAAITSLPPSQYGYKGLVLPHRLGVYAEGVSPVTNRIYVADPMEVALGRLAWREWITVRGGQAGGSQAVTPGGNALGGFGVGGLLTLLTGVPLSTALGSAPPPDLKALIQEELIKYLQAKASAR
jgi:hypothetical protein